jgi:glutaminyl-peptide cyclotransferase
MKLCVALLAVFLLLLASCNRSTKDKEEKVNSDLISYEVVRTFPHDPEAFTQGLITYNGKLYESTGREGTSWIAEVALATGKQEKKIELDKNYFGEGITIINNKIYQLTYTTHVGFVYDLKTYKKLSEFSYDYQGWGVTTDGKHLLVSDGSEKIHFLDTLTLKETKSISIKYQNNAVKNLNELEWIDGYLYANQWQTNTIFKIDISSASVVGRMDFTSIAQKIENASPDADVLNGIAYEAKTKTLLITGKLWPVMYAVRLK